MKLRKLLKTLDDKQIICIGSNSGNGFVYIGEAGNIDLINKSFFDYRENYEKKAKEALESLPNLIMKAPLILDLQKRDKQIMSRAEAIYGKINLIKQEEIYRENYRDPEVRSVISIDDRDEVVDGKMKIVIIEGNEKGPFWFKKDFDAIYNK